MSEVPDQRFGGVSRVYGQQALNHFQQLHIVVAGLGGVGSWAVEALARTGIDKLTLIDLDDVCTTNINRCLLYTSPSPRDATLSRMPSSA